MTIALALAMVVVAIVLLSIDRIPIEVSSIGIVVLLVFTGLATPQEALAASSTLIGKSVRRLRFADRYGVLVLGLHRHPTLPGVHRELDLLDNVSKGRAMRDVPLSAGDVLLVSGTEPRIRELANDDDVIVLGTVEYERPRYRRARSPS